MRKMLGANIYEVVGTIQADKESRRVVPAHATFREIKAVVGNVSDADLFEALDAEANKGLIRRVRTLNSSAYEVEE